MLKNGNNNNKIPLLWKHWFRVLTYGILSHIDNKKTNFYSIGAILAKCKQPNI